MRAHARALNLDRKGKIECTEKKVVCRTRHNVSHRSANSKTCVTEYANSRAL